MRTSRYKRPLYGAWCKTCERWAVPAGTAPLSDCLTTALHQAEAHAIETQHEVRVDRTTPKPFDEPMIVRPEDVRRKVQVA